MQRSLKKICDACREIGSEIPRYELRGNGIRVHFTALQSALIKEDKEKEEAPKHQSAKAYGALEDTLAFDIIKILKDNPAISQDEIAKALNTTRRIVQRVMNSLKSSGRIERVGGKRYGHWGVLK